MIDQLYRNLSAKITGKCLRNVSLAPYTTWKVGGPADLLAEPIDERDLAICLEFASRHHLPVTVLGNGSNLLVLDGGIRGLVLRLAGKFKEIHVSGTTISAGAAVLLPRLSRTAAEHGLTGLEFAVGIPASVGGAVVMNAGVPEAAIGDVVSKVQVMDRRARSRCLDAGQLRFRYRGSGIKPEREIVLWVEMHLAKGDPKKIKQLMEEQLQKRKARQPLNMPNAGSVFKNPPEFAAGYLIDKAGLKGISCGGAKVSEKHANFIVNTGTATAKDILSLIRLVQKEVAEIFDVKLDTEINIVGEEL
ncbi:MAG: UDP-N-acetylmuramate dehydrogenase [Thermoanaerobacteraceae bacterium]|nr:UDP-N-acetylmuramate dehydrogenase [Thermoanaerobacteraceae bacterium]